MADKSTQVELETKAKEKIFEHARDYLTCKLTLPLGDPVLKNVHTNQFLFMKMPEDFPLENWETIAQVLSSSYTRYGGADYDISRLYIEGCTIDVDVEGNAKMGLNLNAFPSGMSNFSEAYRGFTDAYKNATSNSSSTKTKTNAVASDNKAIKNGWWGQWVTDLVKKNVGSETDVLKNCKTMYHVFKDHARYHEYYNMKYTLGSTSKLEAVWKNNTKLNCGDGANFLSAFYSCCGATSGIYLTYDAAHYIVKCTINGKDYWTDQSGPEGGKNTLRDWNQTWHGYRSGNYKGKYV